MRFTRIDLFIIVSLSLSHVAFCSKNEACRNIESMANGNSNAPTYQNGTFLKLNLYQISLVGGLR